MSDCADSLAADSGRSSTESLLSRSSPAGMSPQVQEQAPSLSASLGSAETLCDDDVPPIPLDTHRDGELQQDVAVSVHGETSVNHLPSVLLLPSKPQALRYR